MTDEPTRAKLDEVLAAPGYDEAQAKLDEIRPDVTDSDLVARLDGLPNEKLDDRLEVSYILATEPGTKHTAGSPRSTAAPKSAATRATPC